MLKGGNLNEWMKPIVTFSKDDCNFTAILKDFSRRRLLHYVSILSGRIQEAQGSRNLLSRSKPSDQQNTTYDNNPPSVW